MAPMSTLSGREIADAGLDDWAYLLGGLETRLETTNFATGLRLVASIGAAAEAADHHPDMLVQYRQVTLTLTSHDAGGLTERDFRLAKRIDG